MDATKRYLVPRKGLIVRDPKTMFPLPEKGATEPWTGWMGRYWRRRAKCGDVKIGNPPTTEKSGNKLRPNREREEK